ncbi:GntR family transcriptional regulator [Clostridium chauvoei]|uniref:GntR family transcriptional regulator n=2 Tax=Clostridium chauvoei TaxID=46867 RepID=A0ABD4RKF1_9CLOT|nr:GntR family transcriptional regulator [Clostridium chauvoei]ATD55153.1 GntR family transcriptional regulator [Clostridium chauvoei]ATD57174.1 GntR family transcriptional regulator [Clostridium chauvoei]MBX7281833.1 GntR family transcriptional regulator [Clostridium chauvoei]MBX7284357.1 GntR family transcriptional regulator [Clostridium chauvoei]MBX7286873.1 GntR family transcriptional regulator [Clostridium chauvoei]
MIKIDARSSTPIYEQIIIGIKELILKGIIKPGEKLPSVRELSVMVTVNPNTISKAYGELEKDGAIESLRGRGTFVVEDYKPKHLEEKFKKIKNELKKIMLEAKYLGLKKEDLIKALNECFNDIEGGE